MQYSYFVTVASALFSFIETVAGEAPIINNNPTDVTYRAEFPEGGSQGVTGYVEFSSPNGTTKVNVKLDGVLVADGKFSYHIHSKPVGGGGNCTATAGHFNPFNGTATCKLSEASLCELGNLSGLYGAIDSDSFETEYFDPYLSLDSNSPSFIGDKRSITIHFPNTTRLACADIVKVGDVSSNSSSSSNSTSSSSSTVVASANAGASINGNKPSMLALVAVIAKLLI